MLLVAADGVVDKQHRAKNHHTWEEVRGGVRVVGAQYQSGLVHNPCSDEKRTRGTYERGVDMQKHM